jgi:hypothetical protein
MVYACRICPNVDETVDSGLVYRNDLLKITSEFFANSSEYFREFQLESKLV